MALIGIGLVMISSASVVVSYQNYGNNFYYVTKQLYNVLIGFVIFAITARIDYRWWKKISAPLLIASIIMLILVFLPYIGIETNGANRWINLGFTRFQSSELAKLAIVIYLATWLGQKGNLINNIKTGLLPIIFVVGLIAFLTVIEPDMGTTIIICFIALIMYFIAGGSWSNIGLLILSGGLSAIFFILIEPFRFNRLKSFLDPTHDTLGISYHANQALLAIGSGGLWGLGFGQSRQKYLYLPEPQTDSIFAIMAEELGFVRILIILAIFLYFVIRGMNIARNAPDKYSALLVSGIISWVAIQSLLNLAAMLSLVPLTGVPLPFISYGGSSTFVLMAAMGIVVNISKHQLEKK